MSTLSELIEALNADDEFNRREAVADLIQLGARAVGSLVASLVDPRPRVRSGAATVLGKVAQSDSGAIAGLTHALGDSVHEVRKCAADALRSIGKPVVPVLIACLGSENPKAQEWAAIALGDIGAEAREAESALWHLLRHSEN